MKRFSASWLGVGGDTGVATRCTFLLAWMLVAFAPVAATQYLLNDAQGVLAATAAMACCLAGAVPPVLFATLLPGPQYALAQIGLGMASRMTIPLVLGLTVHFQRGSISQAGFLLDLVVFFWVGLTYDTLCLLAEIQQQTNHPANTR